MTPARPGKHRRKRQRRPLPGTLLFSGWLDPVALDAYDKEDDQFFATEADRHPAVKDASRP